MADDLDLVKDFFGSFLTWVFAILAVVIVLCVAVFLITFFVWGTWHLLNIM